MEVKLYVGNLHDSATDHEIRGLFARAGNVTSVNFVRDRQTGQAKHFAYVSMGSQAEAQTAISMFNAYSLADQALIVKAARTREAPGIESSRLSAFAPARQKKSARQPKAASKGYHSRLSAFGGEGGRGGARRGAGKRDL